MRKLAEQLRTVSRIKQETRIEDDTGLLLQRETHGSLFGFSEHIHCAASWRPKQVCGTMACKYIAKSMPAGERPPCISTRDLLLTGSSHKVTGWSITMRGKEMVYDIQFKRLASETSMDAVLRRPYSDEIEDYKEYKRIRNAIRLAHEEAAKAIQIVKTPTFTISSDGADDDGDASDDASDDGEELLEEVLETHDSVLAVPVVE